MKKGGRGARKPTCGWPATCREAGGTFAGVGASEKLWGSDLRAHTGSGGGGSWN